MEEHSFEYVSGKTRIKVTCKNETQLLDVLYDFINLKKFGISPIKKRRVKDYTIDDLVWQKV